jgi:hypothetical protein
MHALNNRRSFSAQLIMEHTSCSVLWLDYYMVCVLLFFYGCETWPLTLREKRRLRVFANRVLRRIFWPMRDKVTGEWRKLHNEEFNDHTPRQILLG